MSGVILSWFYVVVFLQNALCENSRQKRCIVIQKQSGTHGDSTEGDGDEDYRRPQPKEPKMDRIGYKPMGPSPMVQGERDFEVEEFTPEIPKLRKKFQRLRMKKNENSRKKSTD